MKYEFDFPYEIKTCQTCPFMSLYKGSTQCAFAPYGEQRSIRYGTCPLRVAGWHTGIPTEEGYYIAHFWCCDFDGDVVEYDEVYELSFLLKLFASADDNFKVVAWMKYEPYEGEDNG